jgi:hypothetical protein
MRTLRSMIVGTVAIVALAGHGWCEDMYLTLNDGTEIVLHDNYRWDFKKSRSRELDEDVQITLDDGVTIVVARSGEWGYAEDVDGGPRRQVAMQSAYATSMAKHEDVAEATLEAHRVVAQRLAAQMIKGIWAGEAIDEEKLIGCIEGANKAVDSDDKRLDDGWRVNLRVELDRQAILGIVECVESDATTE